MDYEQDIRIDENDLKSEWLNIAFQIAEYGEKAADAKRSLLKAEEQVKTVRSTTVLAVGKNPDLLGPGVKPTAVNVEAYYRTARAYKEAKNVFIEAQHEFDVLNGAVYAFQAKKQALESLVKLFGMSYFSEPSEDVTKSQREKRKSKIKKRRNK